MSFKDKDYEIRRENMARQVPGLSMKQSTVEQHPMVENLHKGDSEQAERLRALAGAERKINEAFGDVPDVTNSRIDPRKLDLLQILRQMRNLANIILEVFGPESEQFELAMNALLSVKAKAVEGLINRLGRSRTRRKI